MNHKGKPPVGRVLADISFAATMALFLWWPATLAGLFVVPVKLLLGWDGRTGPFGNRKHTPTQPRWHNFWQAWHYLAIRNPVSNYSHDDLAATINTDDPQDTWGFTGATDHGVEGWYYVAVGYAFEFRYVRKTFPGKCLEMRLGWKINGLLSQDDGYRRAAFVFRINPVRDFG